MKYLTLLTTNGYRYKIDEEDLSLVSQYTWTKPSDGYIKKYRERNVGGKRVRWVILMHRLILNAQEGQIVDHINGDTTDNRKSNLRVVSKSLNSLNSPKVRSSTGYRGVTFSKQSNKYQARITIDKKSKHLGSFTKAEDAGKAYLMAQKEYLNGVQ